MRACSTLQRRAAQSVDTTVSISGKQSLYVDLNRHQNLTFLFTGPLPTFPENFMQMRSEVFAQSC